MELLQSDSTDTPKYKFALQKYSLYLYALVEDFERGMTRFITYWFRVIPI